MEEWTFINTMSGNQQRIIEVNADKGKYKGFIYNHTNIYY